MSIIESAAMDIIYQGYLDKQSVIEATAKRTKLINFKELEKLLEFYFHRV